MGSWRLALYFVFVAVLGSQMWQHLQYPWTWQQTTGLGMVIVGFCFWLIAHIQLGASFSLKPQARALVKRGLYSRIRNPIYVFGAIAIAGLVLYWESTSFSVGICSSDPTANQAGTRGSTRSGGKFGEEYRAYRRQTWF